MEIFQIRILITIMATTIAIDSAILTYLFSQYASILLTIEVILLPSIYIIGNYYVEELIKKQYEEEIIAIEKEAVELGNKYLKQKYLNKGIKDEKKKRKKEG